MSVFELKGKTALVTGGGSGIGFGISEALCDSGANVVIGDMDETLATRVAKDLNSKGFHALGKYMDVTNLDS